MISRSVLFAARRRSRAIVDKIGIISHRAGHAKHGGGGLLIARRCAPWARGLTGSAERSKVSMQELVKELHTLGLAQDERVAAAIRAVDRHGFVALSDDVDKLNDEIVQGKVASVNSLNFVPAIEESELEKFFSLDHPVDHAQQLFLLQDWLRPGASVLDCGSGSGYLSTVLALLVGAEKGSSGRVTALERRTAFSSACVPRIARSLNALTATAVSTDDAARTLLGADSCVTQRIIVLPVDGTDDLVFPNAPYDAIRVGFSLPSKDSKEAHNLLKQLRRGGRMIAHLGDDKAPSLFDKDKETGEVVVTLASDHPARFPPALGGKRVIVEKDTDQTPEELTEAAEREAATMARRDKFLKELQTWRTNFEAAHGRRPTRDDMFKDETASALFKEFSLINKPNTI